MLVRGVAAKNKGKRQNRSIKGRRKRPLRRFRGSYSASLTNFHAATGAPGRPAGATAKWKGSEPSIQFPAYCF